MNYTIAVRSYKRYEQVTTHTLAMLSRQKGDLLKKTVLLVANEEEKALYEESCNKSGMIPSKIIVTELGAAKAVNFYLRTLEEGDFVFCIDDDIKSFQEYKDIKNFKEVNDIEDLGKYLEYGFKLIYQYDLGGFSFDYGNPYFKQETPFVKVGMRRIPGGFFGTRVCSELQVNFEHEEDNVRAFQLLEKFSRNAIFNWFGVKMAPIGKNPGGMAADNSRKDTKKTCEDALAIPGMTKYFKDEIAFNDTYNVFTLKYKSQTALKKLPNFKPEIHIQEYFGDILPEEEKFDLFTLN